MPVLVAGLLVVIGAAATWHRLNAPSDGTRAGYVTSTMSEDGLSVEPISGAETPLDAGDRVLAIDGIGLESWLRADTGADAPDDATAAYLVNRSGGERELEVPLGTYPLTNVLAEAWATILLCVAWAIVASYVYARQPSAVGAAPLLVAASGLVASTVPWILGVQAYDLVDGMGFWLWVACVFGAYSLFWSASVHLVLVFPRSVRVARTKGVLPFVYLAPIGIMVVWIAVVAWASGSILDALGSWTTGQLGLVLVASVSLVVLVVAQVRSATTETARNQVRWVAWGGGTAIVLTAAFWFVPELLIGRSILPWSAVGLVGLFFPVALAIAVLRHRLFDIDVVINRSLVYGGLTAVVITVYVVIVAGLSSVVGGDGGFAASLLATGVAALAALPVRDRLQRAVNRLMYGERDDPYRAINRLAERLSASLATEEVLPTIVATVAAALRLPYVAIELLQDSRTTIAASTGQRPAGELVRIPLVDGGETVGELAVAPRSPNEAFSPSDRALLDGLAREAGRAARSVRLAAEIDRSRREIVSAREEERRRMRRDLHDGLGPALAGARLMAQAARDLAPVRTTDATTVLADLDAELASILDEVRRISRDLRPPALDELGLVPAIRARAAQFTLGSELEIRVDGPDDLPPLPAAVETAAYRIAVEALANVQRHSAARSCAVRIRIDDALEIEVEDDGTGIVPGTPAGVGLAAMRERASEVGGTCEIGDGDGAGTRVVAHLPLAAGAG
jgi:signal transduction histidine kinase